MKQNVKLYNRRFGLASIIYVVLILGTRFLLNDLEIAPPLNWLIALLPLLPILYGMYALFYFVRSVDELQRQIQLEAAVFSLFMTGILTFAAGLLEGLGIPQISMLWVFPLLVLMWGIGLCIAKRRYQ
jgi:hypothetical protein